MNKNVPVWLTRDPIAHRGLHEIQSGIPENSIPAFERAIADNYPIELDIHLSADQQLIVFHDATLQRMCGLNKKIADCSSGYLLQCPLAGTQFTIPHLEDVLDLVGGKVPILIEIKNSDKSRLTEQLLARQLTGYNGLVAIQSFDPFSVSWFYKHYPQIPRGQLASDFRGEKLNALSKYLLSRLFFNFLSKPDFIGYDVRALPSQRLKRLQKSGYTVIGWTLRSTQEFERIKDYCNNIIFEGFIPPKPPTSNGYIRPA